MGPVNESMKAEAVKQQSEVQLSDRVDHARRLSALARSARHRDERGIARRRDDRAGSTSSGTRTGRRTPDEMERMKGHVRRAMEEGALGLGSSLIYVPASFSTTEELDRAREGRGASTTASTSRTCAAKAGAFSRRSTRPCASPASPAVARGDLSPEGRRTPQLAEDGGRRSSASKPRGRRASHVTANMYPYVAGATGSPRRCRRGYRRAASMRGSSVSRIRRCARESRRDETPSTVVGEPATAKPARRTRCASSASGIRRSSRSPARPSRRSPRCAARRPKRPRWISSSRIIRASIPPTS